MEEVVVVEVYGSNSWVGKKHRDLEIKLNINLISSAIEDGPA